MGYEEQKIEGRNAVLEAFRSGKTIDKLFVLDGCQDGPVRTIVREAKKYDTIINYVAKERLDQMSETGKHQGVIAYAAAYEYAEVESSMYSIRSRHTLMMLAVALVVASGWHFGLITPESASLAGFLGVTMNAAGARVVDPILTTVAQGYQNAEFVGMGLLALLGLLPGLVAGEDRKSVV